MPRVPLRELRKGRVVNTSYKGRVQNPTINKISSALHVTATLLHLNSLRGP